MKETKEDLTSSRFTLPKGAIAYDRAGRPVYGLLDVPARRQLMHQFEHVKAAWNIEAEERVLRPKSGQRGAARDVMLAEWARREAEAQGGRTSRKHSFVDLSLRTSADNPLAGSVVAPVRPASAKTSLRVFNESQLPANVRTHVKAYMAPIAADAEQERKAQAEELKKRQVLYEQLTAAKTLAQNTSQQYPHGLTKLAMAKLKAADPDLAKMADLPALSLEYASTSRIYY